MSWAVLSSGVKSQPIPLGMWIIALSRAPALHAPPLSGQVVAVSVFTPTVALSQCLCSNNPYFT